MPDWFNLVPGWLGRALKPDDGLPPEKIDAAVTKMTEQGFCVPVALRTLHLRLGACEPFMRGFNSFIAPEAWQVENGFLKFLDENQEVCHWVVDADEQVWMWAGTERYLEKLALNDFLAVVMPYQLAQGGWPCGAYMTLPLAEAAPEREKIAAELGWPQIVRHNGLTIHSKDASMLWWLDPAPDDMGQSLFASCLRQSDLDDLCLRFGFVCL